MNQNIDSVVAGTVQVLKNNGYTEKTIKSITNTFNTIAKLHKSHDRDEYDPVIISAFIDNTKRKYTARSIGRVRYMHLLKTADYLMQFHDNGTINMISRNIPTGLSPYYDGIILKIQEYADWNDKSKATVRSFSLPYFKWLYAHGYFTFEQMDSSAIRKYLMDCSNRMSLNSLDTAKRQLKKLHSFLYDTGITQADYNDVLDFVTPTEHKISRPVPQDEIADILSIIDRNTSIGKRDYAIILLAAVTGLRSVDIVNLCFSEVDWINGEFHIQQSKTGKMLSLPLTSDVGEALSDYILNGRPQGNEPYIFLRNKSPLTQLGKSVPYMVFNAYRQKLGLPKVPFHGLRRSVGSNLVMAGVPVTTVAQILGHSSIEPTKQYISEASVECVGRKIRYGQHLPERGASPS